MRLFSVASPAPHYSWFRLRRSSRELIEQVQFGQPVPESVKTVRCRLLYQSAKPGRLGDFPRIDSLQGIALSEKARAVLCGGLSECFDILPIQIDGFGVERRGTWEYPNAGEVPTDAWEHQPYWFLHPSRSFQGKGAPERIPLLRFQDSSDPDPQELERALAAYRAHYKGMLHEVLAAVAGAPLPPVFVARDSAQICFTEEFHRICKKARLVGAHTYEITNDDATQI